MTGALPALHSLMIHHARFDTCREARFRSSGRAKAPRHPAQRGGGDRAARDALAAKTLGADCFC